jgi:hypothetical protein
MAEQLLLVRLAPLRNTGLPFVKLAIPDPTPNNAGDLRTNVPDAEPPMASPDRPMIKFVTK